LKKVVLDTNVIISALFWGGPPRAIYELIRSGKLSMLGSEDMERELIRVLGYAKFGLSAAEIMPLIANLRIHTVPIITRGKLHVIAADPTDNIFLECAVEGCADYIVSGDKHLLDLTAYKGIPIVRASAFLARESATEAE
jgi:putative PIN family toxin of toxin-antitoxin system